MAHSVSAPYFLFHSNKVDEGYRGYVIPTLFTILYALDKYEKGEVSGLEVDFGQGGINYDEQRGPNWWRYFFKNNQWGIKSDNARRIPDAIRNAMHLRARFDMSSERLHYLLKKYIVFQDDIMQEAQEFARNNFVEKHIVGAYYYDSSDPCQCEPIIDEQFIELIDKQMVQHKNALLFVVSACIKEDDVLRKKLQERYGEKFMCSSVMFEKSVVDESKNFLVATILLSKCNALVAKSGIMKSIVSGFNPNLPITVLGHDSLEGE